MHLFLPLRAIMTSSIRKNGSMGDDPRLLYTETRLVCWRVDDAVSRPVASRFCWLLWLLNGGGGSGQDAAARGAALIRCGWVMSRDCWIIERLSRVRRYGVLRSLSPACQDNGRGPRAGGPGKHPSVLLCSGEARILAEFHVPAHWHFLQGQYDRPIVAVTLYVRHSDVSWDIHYGKRSFYCVKLYCVHCDCYDHYYSVSQKKNKTLCSYP